ncbi:Cna B-type domain-containing protein [Clostridiales bacterium]|nr:Cna B-type domain-containing protein [Clostridiales bacterium]
MPTATVEMTNNEEGKGQITLTKKNSAKTKALEGAEFDLYRVKTGEETADVKINTDGKLTTNADGQIIVGDLEPGDYYFIETKAPDGYVAVPEGGIKSSVETIAAGQSTMPTATVEMTNNEEGKGQITLTKKNSAKTKALEGAEFDLYRVKTGEETADVKINTDGKLTTNADGQIIVGDLEPGDYYFIETKAPDGYVAVPEGGIKSSVETIAAGQSTMPTATVEMTNAEEAKGQITLTKLDKDDNTKKLSGAKFDLYRVKTGSETEDKKINTKELVTDKNGEITVTDLEPGTYYFVEIAAPENYVTPSGEDAKTDTRIVEAGKATLDPLTVSVENTHKVGDLVVSKTVVSDAAADKDQKFIFTIELSDKTIEGKYGDMTFDKGVAKVELKGGENAKAEKLPVGTEWKITEAADDNFDQDKNEETGKIVEDGCNVEFTNTRKTGDLEVSKTVVSDAAADADQKFTFTIKLSDETISGTYGDMTFEKGIATVELKGGENATAKGLPTAIDYTVTEAVDENFTVEKTGDTGTIVEAGCEAAFTNARKTGDLTVSKTVVSDAAADADQKFTFTIKLSDETISGTYGDMTFEKGIATVELKGGENATAKGLPTAIDYTVTEAVDENFTVEKTGDTGTIVEAGCEAAFTNARKTGDLKISKEVVSDAAADAEQKFTFTIELSDKTISGTYGDMTFEKGVATVELKGGESTTAKGLPTGIDYTVTEAVDENFKVTKTGDTGTIDEAGCEAAFTNTRTTGDLEISKTVVSFIAADADQKFTFTIELSDKTISGTYGDMTFEKGIATVELKGGESATAEGLPTGIDYQVTEATEEAFNTEKTGDTGTIDEAGCTAAFTNTRKTANVKVSKVDVASGEELEGATIQILRKATEEDAADEKTKYADETKTLVIVEEWVSSDEAHEIEGLLTDTEYTLRETVAPDGYTVTVDTTFTIDETGKVTSTGTVSEDGVLLVEDAMTRIRVSKVDAANGEELEGATIQILRKATEEDAADKNTKYADEAKTLVIVEEWVSETEAHVVEGLLTDTEYILRETVAPHGYDVTTDTMFIIDETGKVTSTGTISEDGVLLVEDDMFLVCAAVKKVWNDEENRDGRRPLKVTVDLLANGTVVRTIDLTAENHWMAVADKLPMVDKALKTIEYTWAEHEPGNGYKLTGNVKNGTLTTLTNSRDVELTEVSVEKKWNDNGNASNMRPDKIRVQLYADGEACGEEVVLNAGNGWKHTWTGLKKNCNKTAIAYTVEELEVPEGYQVSKSGNAAAGYVLTNTLETGSLVIRKTFDIEEIEPEEEPETELIDINVKKVWNDSDDQDGIRPESITVHLLAGGEMIDTVQLKATTGWKYTFKDLPKTVRGNRISYSVTEDPVPGYTCEVHGYTIRNTHKPEETNVSVRKVWDDRNNALGIRPTSIRMTLSNGTNVLLSEANGWQATITGLPKRMSGEEINYTWVEQEVVGYRQESKTVQGSVTTFTNTPTDVPNVPEGMKKPKLPGGEWAFFEEYQTALGVETIINHVGDCFD